MAANTADLGKLVATEIAPTIAEYGLAIPELYVENISLPPVVEEALDRRTSMGVVGDLGRYTQFSAAEAMTRAAANPGGAGTGIGAGIGMAMGAQMARQGPWGSVPAAPPPPPEEHVWHVAEGGETRGPFSKASLGRMATGGEIQRETFVWTPGQDGWQQAGDVPELARLFTVMPPPPPEA
jgi:hypothetical protein